MYQKFILTLCPKYKRIMETKQLLEQLKAIAELKANQITTAHKNIVREACAAAGIEYPAKPTCKMCYIDTAVQCYAALNRRAEAEKVQSNGRKYVLRPGTDIYFGDIRINEATITDKLAADCISRGLDPKYFIICE